MPPDTTPTRSKWGDIFEPFVKPLKPALSDDDLRAVIKFLTPCFEVATAPTEPPVNQDGLAHEAMKSPVIRDFVRGVMLSFEAIPPDVRVWMLSSIVLSVVTQYTADPVAAMEFFTTHVRDNLPKAMAAHAEVINANR